MEVKMKKKKITSGLFLTLTVLGLLIFGWSLDEHSDNVHMYKAKVIDVDNDSVTIAGLSAIGTQGVTVKVLNGKYKGEVLHSNNILLGQLDFDERYEKEETIVIAIKENGNKVDYVRCVEQYRMDYVIFLFLLFVVVLILYAKWIGVRALFSFVATFFILFRILIPLLLKGYNPILLATVALYLITGVIIFSVAGFSEKGYCAFLGTVVGLLLTLVLTLLMGDRLGLLGMTAPYAQSIYFSGNFHLNMNEIFYASILIGASGAAMDIAMDVASSTSEILHKKPDISSFELVKSGFNIGRDVIGTMTTTLLLAYSGGYLTLLMMFQLRGTHIMQLLNMKIVVAELIRILIGSMGLLFVAPTTAVVAGLMMTRKRKQKK